MGGSSADRPGNCGPGHIPVMAEAVLDWLRVQPDGIYVDCTVGAAGHSIRIAKHLRAGRLIALDRDMKAVEIARSRLAAFACATVHHANYGALIDTLTQLKIGRVDGVLIDAGCSSMQLDDAGRGFSFQEDGPLDMRMDPSGGSSAAEYLARVSEPELAGILRRYGDVRMTKRIAKAIVKRAREGALGTTRDLVRAVCDALSFVNGIPDEVRTVFQAVRMAVNEEPQWLDAGLRQAMAVLNPGGRLVAIAFHSGEDRVVKQVLRETSRKQRLLRPDGRVREVKPPSCRILTPKPVVPGEDEIRGNPRAKSARLRAAERL